MMTAMRMFEKHPNKADLKFIMVPQLRETLNTNYESIPIDIFWIVTKYQ